MKENGYEQLLARVHSSKKLTNVLRGVNMVAFIYAVFLFCFNFIDLAIDSGVLLLKYLLVCFVPFALVSVVRKIINRRRPYEVYDFCDKAPKDKLGQSFPSRHATSVFVIATVALFFNLYLALPLMLIGLLMCIARVLLGIHFISDVLAGAAIGVISALLGAWILF